ncbi:hypothetical protein LCGC14_1773550, partial [marine sediment metagenome]
MQKKSKLRKGCGWISLACSILFFFGLTGLVLLNVSCIKL